MSISKIRNTNHQACRAKGADRIRVTKRGSHLSKTICYQGLKEDLLAAGVATEDMFPAPPQTRRYSGNGDKARTREYFATTQRGDEFMVTRWRFWNDKAGGENDRRECDAKMAAYRECDARYRPAGMREGDSVRDDACIELMRLPRRIKDMLSACARQLRRVVAVSPVVDAKIAAGAKWANELEALADQIGEATVERVSTLKVVSILRQTSPAA